MAIFPPLIPAKAGIQAESEADLPLRATSFFRMDPRLRGDERKYA